jgi:imidazole glycerol-phosphate synthase subunit HisH
MLAILDYEAGNQTSVLRALRFLGIPGAITRDPAAVGQAEGIIFPGVGAAGQAMDNLNRTGLERVLKEQIEQGKPLLGICVGCQILLDHSQENDTATLGIVPGRCVLFDKGLKDEQGLPIRIPHMGWNSVQLNGSCELFDDIAADAEFYFVHSYYPDPKIEYVLGTTTYGLEFCSVHGRRGLWAVQFHPEKSGRPGLTLLRNFYRYCTEANGAQ